MKGPLIILIVFISTSFFQSTAFSEESSTYQTHNSNNEKNNRRLNDLFSRWKNRWHRDRKPPMPIDDKYDGFSHYWEFDEHSSPYKNQLGGEATCTNCPDSIQGKFNGALEFNGIDTLVQAPYDDSLAWNDEDNAPAFTIQTWIKRSTPCTDFEVIIGRDDPDSPVHWALACENGFVEFILIDSNGDAHKETNQRNINDNQWHHIAYVKAGSWHDLYVDGVALRTTLNDFPDIVYLGDFIGNEVDVNIGGLEGTDFYFKGIIDEVSIKESGINLDEIRQYYITHMPHNYKEQFADGCQSPTRILPLGDLHTQGDAALTPPAISYRPNLFQNLEQGNYLVDFVGSQQEMIDSGFNYDSDHQGNKEYNAEIIRDNIIGILSDTPADIVLLDIGHSDYNSPENINSVDAFSSTIPKRTAAILDNIHQTNPDTLVMLAIRDSFTPNFTEEMENMVWKRFVNGQKIMMVDIENSITEGSDFYGGTKTYAYEPYSAQGYKKMADNWFDSLATILPKCAP